MVVAIEFGIEEDIDPGDIAKGFSVLSPGVASGREKGAMRKAQQIPECLFKKDNPKADEKKSKK